MIALIQRVKSAKVVAQGKEVSSIDKGFLVFLGVEKGDDETDVEYISKKIVNLRIFEDEKGKMSKSIKEIGGSILLVSEFTLVGNLKKGYRPDFSLAENKEKAKKIYEEVAKMIEKEDIIVKLGIFGAYMEVFLINDGPVTIILNSKK